MTPAETVILARYVRALCPQQKFDEYTPDAWHDVLQGYLLTEARTAAAALAGRQPFVAPGEIATEIRRARADRMQRHVDPTPQADPDDPHAYRAEIAATRYAVATGQQEPDTRELIAGAMHPTVAERLATLGTYVPRAVDEQLDAHRPIKAARRNALTIGQPDALAVACPWCQARPGQPCRQGKNRAQQRSTPHPSRLDSVPTPEHA